MSVDARPVIDQLTEPTALNVLWDVQQFMCERVLADGDIRGHDIRDAFDPLIAALDLPASSPIHDVLLDVVAVLHVMDGEYADSLVSTFTEEMEARLTP